MIKIVVTNEEFLISIPYHERDRAKRIPNYRWDPSKKLWRYYRSRYIYDQILHEFGPNELEWVEEPAGREAIPATDKADQAEEVMALMQELIATKEQVIEGKAYIIKFFEAAEQNGFPKDADVDDLFNFSEAAYKSNMSQAELVSNLASTEAELRAVKSELASLKCASGKEDGDEIRRVIVKTAWNSLVVPFPDVVGTYCFDHRGPLALQNFLCNLLERRLGGVGKRSTFTDLIREAEDARILSESGARLCHTLRIQRNVFAHEKVEEADVIPRAILCLVSFILVYKELLKS